MLRNKFLIGLALLMFIITSAPTLYAKPDKPNNNTPPQTVTDSDNDGYNSKRDCNDNDPSVHPKAEEICGDGIDQDCSGADAECPVVCTDNDGDSFAAEGGACGPVDCDDNEITVYPGADEICGDTVDQDCSGSDPACTGGPHAGLNISGYPQNCLGCHEAEANEMLGSIHYQWTGEAPDMVNDPLILQGKLTNSVNSYCVNIKNNWAICGSCHTGRGKRPDDPDAGLDNIDCLVCHSEEYATARKRLPDGSLGVENPADTMVRNISKPTKVNCLMCHAKAGGGNGVKRGDLSLEIITNNDPNFDVHMNTSGSDLTCQQCHVFEAHRVLGKGSDLRPTDDTTRGAEIKCTTCHAGKDSLGGHNTEYIGKHVPRIACQTCHIPVYAKVATETHRDWRSHHDGSEADGISGPGHPFTIKESNLIPKYKFWNRLSDNYLLDDDASITYDAGMNIYPTSKPMGDIQDGKLYPFKYKTARQPMTAGDNRLIALDTFEYLALSGNIDTAVKKGLVNMGYPADEPYVWVDTDTYQLINHGVSPASTVLQCSECHENTSRMDLPGELGYVLKGERADVCTTCHSLKEVKPFKSLHDKHVKDKQYDCSWCHDFSRPERNLIMP